MVYAALCMSLCKTRSGTSALAAAGSLVKLIGHLTSQTAFERKIRLQSDSLQEQTASNLRSAAAAAAEAAGTCGSQQQLSASPLDLHSSASHTLLVSEPQDHSPPSQQTEQQSATTFSAPAASVHADDGNADEAVRPGKSWSGKLSLEAESTNDYPANITQQQQQQIQYGRGVAQTDSIQAPSSGQQQQQQQSDRLGLPGTQADAAGGNDGVESVNTEQDEAAKEAYRQWSASFEASQVSTCQAKAHSVKLHGWEQQKAR